MNHTWYIRDLKRTPTSEVVTKVDYECKTQINLQGQRFPVAKNYYGEVILTTGSVSDPNFITYENLTENVVFGWITGSIDTTSIETQNSASIAQRIQTFLQLEAEKTEEDGLPW
tara:strand:+ start:1788 stop:2129 length:342 start_codon:yes stop_codon:yes gene_type:complete